MFFPVLVLLSDFLNCHFFHYVLHFLMFLNFLRFRWSSSFVLLPAVFYMCAFLIIFLVFCDLLYFRQVLRFSSCSAFSKIFLTFWISNDFYEFSAIFFSFLIFWYFPYVLHVLHVLHFIMFSQFELFSEWCLMLFCFCDCLMFLRCL